MESFPFLFDLLFMAMAFPTFACPNYPSPTTQAAR